MRTKGTARLFWLDHALAWRKHSKAPSSDSHGASRKVAVWVVAITLKDLDSNRPCQKSVD